MKRWGIVKIALDSGLSDDPVVDFRVVSIKALGQDYADIRDVPSDLRGYAELTLVNLETKEPLIVKYVDIYCNYRVIDEE